MKKFNHLLLKKVEHANKVLTKEIISFCNLYYNFKDELDLNLSLKKEPFYINYINNNFIDLNEQIILRNRLSVLFFVLERCNDGGSLIHFINNTLNGVHITKTWLSRNYDNLLGVSLLDRIIDKKLLCYNDVSLILDTIIAYDYNYEQSDMYYFNYLIDAYFDKETSEKALYHINNINYNSKNLFYYNYNSFFNKCVKSKDFIKLSDDFYDILVKNDFIREQYLNYIDKYIDDKKDNIYHIMRKNIIKNLQNGLSNNNKIDLLLRYLNNHEIVLLLNEKIVYNNNDKLLLLQKFFISKFDIMDVNNILVNIIDNNSKLNLTKNLIECVEKYNFLHYKIITLISFYSNFDKNNLNNTIMKMKIDFKDNLDVMQFGFQFLSKLLFEKNIITVDNINNIKDIHLLIDDDYLYYFKNKLDILQVNEFVKYISLCSDNKRMELLTNLFGNDKLVIKMVEKKYNEMVKKIN